MTQPNLFDATPSQPTPLEHARRRLFSALVSFEDAEGAVIDHGEHYAAELVTARHELADARAEVARLELAEIERRKS